MDNGPNPDDVEGHGRLGEGVIVVACDEGDGVASLNFAKPMNRGMANVPVGPVDRSVPAIISPT